MNQFMGVQTLDMREVRAGGQCWFDGVGAPNLTLGIPGDYYLEINTGDIYKRYETFWDRIGNIQGNMGAQGIPGLDGKDGNVVHDGAGLPSQHDFNHGDYYIELETGDFYKKNGEVWERLGNLTGPQGIQGPIGETPSITHLEDQLSNSIASLDGDYEQTKLQLDADYLAKKQQLDADYLAQKTNLANDYNNTKANLLNDYQNTTNTLENNFTQTTVTIENSMTNIEQRFTTIEDNYDEITDGLHLNVTSQDIDDIMDMINF